MKVIAKRPIQHKGKTHQVGEVFEVSDQEGQDFIAQGYAEQHKDDPSKPPKKGQEK